MMVVSIVMPMLAYTTSGQLNTVTADAGVEHGWRRIARDATLGQSFQLITLKAD